MPIARINGININYRIEGEGTPLIMVGGLGGDLNMWNPQVSAFKIHYKLIRFDNRGAGKSDKPVGPYSTRMMADDVVGLLDILGIEKAVVFGFSMGGMIAQEIAINYPQRVAKLVLVSTYACQNHESGNTQEAKQLLVLSGLKYIWRFMSLIFNNKLFSLIFFLLRSLGRNKANEEGYKGQFAACLDHNALDRLRLIKAQTLVIVGTNDRLIRPSSSEVIVSKISDAKLVRILNGSHMMSFEMSKIFNTEVLKCLESQ
jgi:pimeloyl-ACP methyl ester carboxylesterase